jgi:hypothetical protein
MMRSADASPAARRPRAGLIGVVLSAGLLAGAFVDSFSMSGQLSAVNDYAMDNCGESI